MKWLERCRIGGSVSNREIPPLSQSFYLSNLVKSLHGVIKTKNIVITCYKLEIFSGGEFDWGGTSVKR